MKTLLWASCLLIITLNHVQADTLFRWKDKEGKVHYGDRPPEDAAKAERKNFGSAAALGEDDLPYSVRKARQDFPVTLYVTPSCGDYCTQARAFLNKRGVPFAEKNVISKEDAEALKAKTGADNVPVLTVGKAVLKGFSADTWTAELDLAGYPKTAPYGSRPQPPVTVKTESKPANENGRGTDAQPEVAQ